MTKAKWRKSRGYWHCTISGKRLKGLNTLRGKTYYFDRKGRQRTGWQKIGGKYRFFRVANGPSGYLVKSKTVNGIRLDIDGIARYGSRGKEELVLMVRANKIYQELTKPAQSRRTRLKKCFSYQLHECGETLYRKFRARSGWHRAYARDILFRGKGSCSSHAAAFAYFANAAGCKKVLIVGSGGHSWAEVDGKVYDPEWSRGKGWRYFAFPMSRSGRNGAPAYRGNRRYIVRIAKRTRAWDKKAAILNKPAKRKSGKTGLVKVGGTRCFYYKGKKLRSRWVTWKGHRYYLDAKGRAVTGPHKAKRGSTWAWWVFASNARLCTGRKTRVVRIDGTRYRVFKSGMAASGWADKKTKRYLETGELATGTRVIDGKLWSFDEKGTYNATKTALLQKNSGQRSDASTVLSILGTPKSRKNMGSSCFILGGTDFVYRYDHVRVSTTLADDGVEYLISFESR